MRKTPRGLRCHIGIFGRRNAGKSSLLNAMTRQSVSIVSEHAGTTTDPVEKPMELLPLGPVLFIDTAGIDDTGALGAQRVEKTRKIFDRTDIALIVTTADSWGEFEAEILSVCREREIPVIAVLNKTDLAGPGTSVLQELEKEKIPVVRTSAITGSGLPDLRQALLDSAPKEFVERRPLVGDLISSGDMAVLVVPIDKEAPKGRLIMPQVQVIREILDYDAYCTVVKERELKAAFDGLTKRPKIVITDSQAFLKAAADTPPEIPMTSFSILFARFQGDLTEMVRGAYAIDGLKSGDRVLIAESCAHHPITEDIGRVKIPRWLTQYVGGKLQIDTVQGADFPKNLSEYKLVIHCGSCMSNRRAMLSRILHCRRAGVPITNYGLTIAFSLGIFERALQPFPAALEVVREMEQSS
ncbi:[FeFe] hydrogenase H-cluster maturation GTPase HydF [bacterium]|nr:[FeFe] hydrogenase H-cluster maturation GTPase HydF [bacterium]